LKIVQKKVMWILNHRVDCLTQCRVLWHVVVQVHLDTDEANAAMLQDATTLELFKQHHDGSLQTVIRSHGKLETNASRRDGRLDPLSPQRHATPRCAFSLHPLCQVWGITHAPLIHMTFYLVL
jgi:hypothetical protein